MNSLTIYNLEELPDVAAKILNFAENNRILLFSGEMGAGKTTLIKAIGRALGVDETMSSPTYSLVNAYESYTKGTIYHFDLYRLKNQTEALDIGIEEYLYSGSYCLVEWPEKIVSLIPESFVSIHLSKDGDNRLLQMKKMRA